MLVLTTFAAASTDDRARDTAPRSWISDPVLRELMLRATQNLTTEYLNSTLTNLTTSFKTRYAHATNHPQVIAWVYDQFKAMGYEPEVWPFIHQGDDRLANVIVTKNGTGSSEFYIVCAHLDSINFNTSWSFPDSPAPGADDDGTGLVAVLALANILRNYDFYYGIKFIAFDDEELDYAVGSTLYTKHLYQSGVGKGLRGVLSADMLGYNTKYLSLDIIYVPNCHDLFTDYIAPVNNEYYFIEHITAKQDPNDPNSWGDIENFWDYSYKAVGFVEFIWPHGNGTWYTANPFYHTESDNMSHINLELFTRASRLFLASLMFMAKPTLPELSVTGVVLPRGPVYDGDRIAINATVANNGNINATNARLDMFIDGELVATKEFSVLSKASTNVTFNWTFPPGGHVINFTVDPLDDLAEFDDGNNNASAMLTVNVRPDMELSRFDIVEDHVNAGQFAQLSVKVVNNGPSYIECWLVVTDNATPDVHPFNEFITLDNGTQWEHVFDWASNINGTHVLEGKLTRCSPADRDLENDHLSDNITINGRPIAVLVAYPKEALTFQDLSFSATGSYDDLALLKYRFDFGDGNETSWTDKPVVKHNYTRDGSYIATLQVQDIYGLESSKATTTVTIDNRPPVSVPKVDHLTADTGIILTFTSDGSFDLDGSIVSYNWSITPMTVTSAKASFSYAFDKAGNYTVRLIVIDDDGNSATASISVKINDRPPKAVIQGPVTVQLGNVARFSANGSFDPEGDPLTYSWDFGDGYKSSEKAPAHYYASPNNYTVRLTVMDKYKNTGNATFKVAVTKKPIFGGETFADAGILAMGICAAILLVFIVYTTSPTRPPPRPMPRPSRRRPKKTLARRRKRR